MNLEIGGAAFQVEVARSAEEQSRGLMYRKRLGPREGMLFVYERDRRLSFWMKNTSVPLSIGFLTKDGTIVQIEDMTPFDLDTVRSVISVRYALELPKGAFAEVGAGVGDRIIFPPKFH